MVSQTSFDEFTLIRQSPIVLLFRFLFVDLFLVSCYLLARFPLQEVYNLAGGTPIQNIWFEMGLFAIVSLLEILLILSIMLIWINNYYVIRSGSILHRRGVFHLFEETYSLKNIEIFTVEQTVFQKIFRYGNIKFYSPVFKKEYFLLNVSQPLKLKEFIQELVIKEEPSEKITEKIIPKVK